MYFYCSQLWFTVSFSDEETGLEVHPVNRPPGCNMERRRSRAVLYQLSGHLQKQDKTKSKLKLNNVRRVFNVLQTASSSLMSPLSLIKKTPLIMSVLVLER